MRRRGEVNFYKEEAEGAEVLGRGCRRLVGEERCFGGRSGLGGREIEGRGWGGGIWCWGRRLAGFGWRTMRRGRRARVDGAD